VIKYQIIVSNSSIKDSGATEHFVELPLSCNIIRCGNIILSLFICAGIIFHYNILLTIGKLQGSIFQSATIQTSGHLRSLLIELLINIIACPPMLSLSIETTNSSTADMLLPIDGIIYTISLTRFYLVFRLYEQYSGWTDSIAHNIW